VVSVDTGVASANLAVAVRGEKRRPRRPIPSRSEPGTIIKNCGRVHRNEMETHDHGSRIVEWAELVGADVPESVLAEQSTEQTETDWQVLTDEAE
jgi:hypothetical protein